MRSLYSLALDYSAVELLEKKICSEYCWLGVPVQKRMPRAIANVTSDLSEGRIFLRESERRQNNQIPVIRKTSEIRGNVKRSAVFSGCAHGRKKTPTADTGVRRKIISKALRCSACQAGSAAEKQEALGFSKLSVFSFVCLKVWKRTRSLTHCSERDP